MIKYYSQDGQDKFLIESLFNNKHDGFFVEIGANDGVNFSNTKSLEDLGWNGICIEPLPIAFNKLKNNRKCTIYNAAIGLNTGNSEFLAINGYSEMLSGIISNYNKKHLDRINKEILQYGGDKQIIKVDIFKFSDLVIENKIDYLSIDTEGSELDVLKSIDFNKHDIYCISFEKNYDDNTATEFLINKNYKFINKIGADMFFVKNIE